VDPGVRRGGFPARGCALDAPDAPDARRSPIPGRAAAILAQVLAARAPEHDGVGRGRDVRFARAGGAGARLVAGEKAGAPAGPQDA